MKRFRFSLLTLIVVLSLMAGIIHLNLSPSLHTGPFTAEEPAIRTIPSGIPYNLCRYDYGWPFAVFKISEVEFSSDDKRLAEYRWQGRWQPTGLFLLDAAVGLAIVFTGGAACEWMVRRRQKKGLP